MPITTCNTHGQTGIVEMCKHLHKALQKGIYHEPIVLPIKTTRMCKKCFKKYGVQEIFDAVKIGVDEVEALRSKEDGVWSIAPDSYFKAAILKQRNPKMMKKIDFVYGEIMKKRGWKCTGCIDQVRLDQARRNNEEPPFEAFENTLMKKDNKRIQKMERRLDKFLNPKGHSLTERKKDFDVEYGSLRIPFTIEITGVKAEKEKQAVLALIDETFKKIKRKQRLIVFRKRRKWRTRENGVTSSRKPAMISEVLVK